MDALYLCQMYSQMREQFSCDNAKLLVLFKEDNLNLCHGAATTSTLT